MNAPIKAVKKSPITITWESVTPTRAKLWIKQTDAARESGYEQRIPSMATVKKYSGEMSRSTWHNSTGDVIRIGTFGGMEVVVDGQHRLMAIALSNVSQDMFVARNVPLDAFKYIDQGNNRTLKDVMDCAQWEDTPTLSSIGRYLWVDTETGSPFGNMSGSENNLSAGSLFDWVSEYHPSIRDVWKLDGQSIKAARKGIKMSESIMGFLFIKFAKIDRALALQIMEYFSNPLMNQTLAPSTNFILAAQVIQDLQREMQMLKAKGMKIRSDEHRDPCTSAIIYAWNCHRDGKFHKTVSGFKKSLKAAEWEQCWSVK